MLVFTTRRPGKLLFSSCSQGPVPLSVVPRGPRRERSTASSSSLEVSPSSCEKSESPESPLLPDAPVLSDAPVLRSASHPPLSINTTISLDSRFSGIVHTIPARPHFRPSVKAAVTTYGLTGRSVRLDKVVCHTTDFVQVVRLQIVNTSIPKR